MENMPCINRAHERILKKVFWTRIDIRASVDQNEYVRLGRKHGRDTRSIDSWQCAKLNRTRGNGCAGVSGAHYCLRTTAVDKIILVTDATIFLPPNGGP